MMRLGIFLYLITALSTAYSALGQGDSAYIKGTARFRALEEDSLSFVKDQLLFKAFNNVITKEINNLGLNSNLFWQKFNEKFDEYFKPIHDSLKETYEIEGENPPTREQKENYKKALRLKKLELRAKYGRLRRAIGSYSIGKMSRSTKRANSRYISIQAKVNRRVLNDIYFKFIKEGTGRSFTTLYLSGDFILDGTNWSEVGVELGPDFTDVVKEHWKKWVEDKLSNQVEKVVLVDQALQREIEGHLKSKTNGNSEIDMGTEENISLVSSDNVSSKYSDSLWLKIGFKIKKTKDRPLFFKRSFEVWGDFILFDLQEKEVLSHYDFKKEEETYDSKNNHKLSSNLASYIYHRPLKRFGTFSKKLGELSELKHTEVLTVKNLKNILDIFEIQEVLSSKGMKMFVESKVAHYDGNKASLLLKYTGKRERFKKTLKSLDAFEIGRGGKISLFSGNLPYEIGLVWSMPGEEVPEENKILRSEKYDDLMDKSEEKSKKKKVKVQIN